MTRELTDLARRMAEQHRPVKEDYRDAALPGYFLVHCRACDGNQRMIRKLGDPEVVCEYWTGAVELGLVTP